MPGDCAQGAEGQGAWPPGLAIWLQVPGEELDEAAVLAFQAERVALRGAGRSQGVGEAAAAVAPGPDLDLLMAGQEAAGAVASQSRPATRSSRNGTRPISACTSVFD